MLILPKIRLWHKNSPGNICIILLPMYLNWKVTLQYGRPLSTMTVNILRTLSLSTLRIFQTYSIQNIPRHYNIFSKATIIASVYLFLTFNTESMILVLLVMSGFRLLMKTLMSLELWITTLLAGCENLDLQYLWHIQQTHLKSHNLQLITSRDLLNDNLTFFLSSNISPCVELK